VLAQFAQHLQAVDLGQVQVDQRHAGQVVAAAMAWALRAKQVIQGLDAVAAERDHVLLNDGLAGH
jgi:hypothetical protein